MIGWNTIGTSSREMSLRVLTIDWQDGEEGELRKQDPGRFTSTAFPDVEMPGTCPVDSM